MKKDLCALSADWDRNLVNNLKGEISMTSSETLDRVWQHIDCLYQTVGELLEVQRTTVMKIQSSDEEMSDTDRQLPDASQLLDQLRSCFKTRFLKRVC